MFNGHNCQKSLAAKRCLVAIHIAVKRTLITLARNVLEAAILVTEYYPQCIGSKHSWRVGEESVSHSERMKETRFFRKSSEGPRAISSLIITNTFSSNLIGALTALSFTNRVVIRQCNRTIGCNRTPVIGQLH